MNRTSLLSVVAAAAIATLTACDSSSVASPTPGAASFARGSGNAPACTIQLPAKVHRDLPAVREVARELNEAFANPQSSVNCGIINGIAQRYNNLVSDLDQEFEDQKLHAACGIATGLVNELRALVATGKLNPIVTHPPVATPNVVDNLDFLRSHFCANARGEEAPPEA